ncbi:GPP34 family phosphoprotein [Thalassobacillus pellis]|uniref:GPP34 family phosphoprotein n=1 Tax=Thalassobacillus pellis TaxID=748008 RepID=UPI00196047E8|nr:hypothetical protein [Thalassobacillus pellis]
MHLQEELLYLSIDEKTKKLNVSKQTLQYALAGAVLMEFALDDCISVHSKKIVWNRADNTYESPVLSHYASKLDEMDGKKLKSVIQKIGRTELIDRVMESLVYTHKIIIKERPFLFLFKSKEYHIVDAQDRQTQLEKLKEDLFQEDIDVLSERTMSLAFLLQICKLDRKLYPDNHKEIQRKLKELRKSNVYAQSVHQVLEDIQTVMTVLLTTTIVTTSSTSTS